MYYLVVKVPSLGRSKNMTWSKPAYTDLRIGFEVTMYFASR
jgi:pyrroloquinoline quinone biosynthesis protein A